MVKVTDLMKSLYESAFSYITKQIDKRIDTINAEKNATPTLSLMKFYPLYNKNI